MGKASSARMWSALGILVLLVAPRALATTSTSIVPAPLVIAPSQYWEGNDGPWSSFTVQVGTPPQNVRVHISTAGTSTWVVIPEGCIDGMPASCTDLRGKEFNYNASSTWKRNAIYALGLESNLGISDSGLFGFDTVGLGWQGSGEPILDHQVVAGIATTSFWLGQFGLTPRPTNFTDFNDPQPSFVQSLRNKSMIPSLSWSYTAGAPYRAEKVLGNLVLGGYDLSKVGAVNMSFPFAPDISRDLTVGVQTITTSVQGVYYDLLPKGIFSFIDSTTPYIWLPLAACQLFEKAFGLTWDNITELYLVNETLHNILVSRNSSVTFKIGNSTTGGQTVDITLPYASFDLQAGFPLVTNSSRYFPLARAANDTQYTLGRTFLQEAYLTADYERSKFYLSQTNFDPLATQHIIPISSVNTTTASSSPPSPSRGLPTAAIVGIAVGSLVLGMALILLAIFLYRRRKSRKPPPDPSTAIPPEWYPSDKKHGYEEHKAELDARDSMLPGVEIGGGERYEMGEMPVPSISGAGSGPTSPVLSEGERTLLEPVYEMVGDGPLRQDMPSPSVASDVSPVHRVPSPIERMPSPIVPMPSLAPGGEEHEVVKSIDQRSHGGAGTSS